MLGLTKKGEYAVRAIIYLAQQPERHWIQLDAMAAATEAPRNFLAKIMQIFSRTGLVLSARGVGGGFSLSRKPTAITLREVVESIEGPILINRCLLGKGTCDRDGTCRAHRLWRQVQNQMIASLENVTIAALAKAP